MSVRQISGGSMKFRDFFVSILIVISAVVIDAKSLRNMIREEDGDSLVMIPFPYHGEDSPKFYVSLKHQYNTLKYPYQDLPVAPMFLRNTRSSPLGHGHGQVMTRYIRDAKRELPNEHDSFIIGSVG